MAITLLHELRKIGHELGLTRRADTVLSDIIPAQGEVKRRFEETQTYLLNEPMIPVYTRPLEHVGHCQSYFVVIEATPLMGDEPRTFELCDQDCYNTLKKGDKVRLRYHDVYKRTTDFVPPDFSKRQQLGVLERIGYQIETITMQTPEGEPLEFRLTH